MGLSPQTRQANHRKVPGPKLEDPKLGLWNAHGIHMVPENPNRFSRNTSKCPWVPAKFCRFPQPISKVSPLCNAFGSKAPCSFVTTLCGPWGKTSRSRLDTTLPFWKEAGWHGISWDIHLHIEFLRISLRTLLFWVDFRTCRNETWKNYEKLYNYEQLAEPTISESHTISLDGWSMLPCLPQAATAWPGPAPTTPGPRRVNSTWGSGASTWSSCTVPPGRAKCQWPWLRNQLIGGTYHII